ncbi:hypothetical protein ACFYXS_26575 [Streptomyces sp. NPDC002574]|uniref:hypothetical protein n=1 Tax=Streptomyces sp. NPDC002574 TaxID=3364652 RepID=UPI0036AA19ED
MTDTTTPRGFVGGTGGTVRRRRKALTTVAALAVMGAGLLVARTALVPWAYPLPGQPRLTGYWQGSVAYADKDVRRVLLQIRHDENCSMACDMTGGIKVCGSGKETHGGLAGDVHNWRGSRFTLDPYLPRDKGDVNIETLDGEWDGEVIRMRARTEFIDASGTWGSSQQPPDPPAFEMRHIDEAAFEAGCAAG